MRFHAIRLAARAVWAARGGGVQGAWCDASAGTASDGIQTAAGEAHWIQVAREGNYKGHASGEFTLDAGVFAQIVNNFRRHPSYHLGPNGYGDAFVIPFDWRHISEKAPETGGAAAIVTQAAQGWSLDLESRLGSDGKLGLWALAVMLDPAKTLIRDKKILWTSVAIWPNSPDPVTGANVGWYLSSIALTNDPFIQGMVPIAADAGRAGAPITAAYYIDPYDKPGKPSDVLEKLRRVFGLAEMSSLADVLREIATLRAAALGQVAAPPGVDVDELVAALRCLFNLPTLSTAEQVFDESDKLVACLAQEQDAAKPKTPVAAKRDNRTENRSMNELILFFCRLLGLVGTPTEEVVLAELKKRHITGDNVRYLLDSAGGDQSDGEMAMTKVKALLAAAGVEDVDGATQALVQKCAEVSHLMEVVPELASMMEGMGSDEDESAASDVRQAMHRHFGVPFLADGVTLDAMDARECAIANTLVTQRTANVDLAAVLKFDPKNVKAFNAKAIKLARQARKDAAEKFRAEFLQEETANEPPAGQHYLFQKVAGQRGGAAPALQLAQAQRGGGGGYGLGRGGATGAAGGGRDPMPEAPQIVDLDRFAGNLGQRLMAAAQDRCGEQWKSLSTEQKYDQKRKLHADLIAAGVDLTPYMPVES